ncbi:hypothetical protein L3X37_12860 [Sabulilitoribacter arenilitoris]|uniref:Uncharacterized protein n=1 Tax=Wocania arenilitoris TaxID=2044858 RepID=A0AAE3EQZ0_9FLAO|nr:hypothetical protein [Wocania arenilitoris]MCF7569247.1 hypothetical protein [Wocania arenilitoris]
MLIPLSMILTGFLSIIYHIKTLKHYSLNFVYKDFKDAVLWIGNLLLAISIFTMAFFMLFAIYSLNEVDLSFEFIYMFIFCGIILLLGVTLILEERLLYRKYVFFKEQSRINKIDDISGHKGDNL